LYDLAMYLTRVVGGVSAGLLLVSLCGCGAGTERQAGPSPSVSSGRAGNGHGAWSYTYVSDEFEYGTGIADIAVVSEKDAWAVLRHSAGPSLLRYDGSEWRPYELPGEVVEAADGRMASVVLTAGRSGDVWLTASVSHGPGTTSTAFAARFDGADWHVVPLPGRGQGIGSPLVLGPADVWAVGTAETAWHWNGRGWTRAVLPFEARLVADPTGTDVWAVGTDRKAGAEPPPHEDAPDPRQPATARWDGTRWKRVPIPTALTLNGGYDFSSHITGATVVAPGEVWATGVAGTEPEPIEDGDYRPADELPFTLYFDGTRWRVPQSDEHPPAAVLGAKKMRDDEGRTHKIGRPPYVPGVTGKVTGVDRKQRLWLDEITPVPGTQEVWAAGQIELGAHGDANFTRAVVVRYRIEG
jgi:hypothetical protein